MSPPDAGGPAPGGRPDTPEPTAREGDWDRSERASFWIALAIALAPIPGAVLISWALGAPPWRGRPSGPERGRIVPADHAPAGPGPGDHRPRG